MVRSADRSLQRAAPQPPRAIGSMPVPSVPAARVLAATNAYAVPGLEPDKKEQNKIIWDFEKLPPRHDSPKGRTLDIFSRCGAAKIPRGPSSCQPYYQGMV